MTAEYRVGDVFDRLAEIPNDSIDLIVTSPPFLALRSYLPDGHPDKAKEIGSEPTPAAFLDTLLDLTDEWGRILAPHGSLCVEMGDTYAGSGGAGGDYAEGGIRDGQGKFDGSGRRSRAADVAAGILPATKRPGPDQRDRMPGWPLAKCKTMLDTLYPASLGYGRNLLTGREIDPWRIRNRVVWARPNPPVGALGDKFRPATSYITVACQGPRRWFDLDAVRTPLNPAGAPPLDWHADGHPEDGDWLWFLPTRGYKGAHHAVFPLALPKKLILAMCPIRVCRTCGTPSERLTSKPTYEPSEHYRGGVMRNEADRVAPMVNAWKGPDGSGQASVVRHTTTTGWTTCGCDGTDGLKLDGHHTGTGWRPGIVLDPFTGSGTTLEAAQLCSRSSIGIDIDARNADLARERVGMFLEVAS